MKYLIEKDKRNRRRFLKFERNRVAVSSLYKNRTLNSEFRKVLRFPSPFSSPTRLKNRCVFSGRSGSIYSDFRLSRHTLREAALNGMLPGVSKSSW